MHIDRGEVRRLHLPMVEPLRAAHGEVLHRATALLRLQIDDKVGWGESVALEDGAYRGESTDFSFQVMRDFVLASLVDCPFDSSQSITATSAIADALLDVRLQTQGQSWKSFVGAKRESVEAVGVIGLSEGDALLASALRLQDLGYRQAKLKVMPGADAERLALLARELPGFVSRVDANGSYDPRSLEHKNTLESFEDFGVELVEQPFAVGREFEAQLAIGTSWDESASSAATITQLIDSGARHIVLKPGWLGGLEASLDIARRCEEREVLVHVGGMIETPIARRSCLALATALHRATPAEVAPESRWFVRTLTEPSETLRDGSLQAFSPIHLQEDVVAELTSN